MTYLERINLIRELHESFLMTDEGHDAMTAFIAGVESVLEM